MQFQGRNHREGSALIVILMVSAIMGFSLFSYLDLIRNQNISTMRSQQWNSCVPILEAGIEEALLHLAYNGTNLMTDEWTEAEDIYSKQREISGGKYVVTISITGAAQVISRAYVKKPMSDEYMEPPRAVKVTLTNAPLFAKGLVTKGSIDLSGNNIKTDSFDSSDPNYSTDGKYDPAKNKAGGDVATNSSVIDSLNVWNADIYGKASTGPGGNVRLGANGSVGSKAWHEAGNTGIEPGWSTDDMNVYFPDVKAPFSGGAFTPTGGIVDGVEYKYVITSGNWELSSLSLSGSEKVYVAGDAVLYVTGDVAMSGQSEIKLSSGSTMRMFVGGADASLGGTGVVNETGNAANFSYYGLPTNTKIKVMGNASFIGTIYAPQAALQLGGGGSDTYDFIGSTITDSATLAGHFNFHYDENLASDGPRRGFMIESWNEMTDPSEWQWEEI